MTRLILYENLGQVVIKIVPVMTSAKDEIHIHIMLASHVVDVPEVEELSNMNCDRINYTRCSRCLTEREDFYVHLGSESPNISW